MNAPTALTPQERLANSRNAIFRHMTRDRQDLEDQISHGTSDPAQSGGKWGVFKHAVQAWW